MKSKQDNKINRAIPDCLWMQAGVVQQKECSLNFQCNTCDYDRELRHMCSENQKLREQGGTPPGETGKLIFWKDRLKNLPPSKRPCIHHMKGYIDFKTCHRNYQCINCDFDQYFNDQFTVYTVIKPVDFIDVSGIRIPVGYYLHKGHMWAKIEKDNEVRIGIDDFALRVLGTFDKFDIPLIGKHIRQGRQDIVATRGNHKAMFASPVNGIVTDVNRNINKQKGPFQADYPTPMAGFSGFIAAL